MNKNPTHSEILEMDKKQKSDARMKKRQEKPKLNPIGLVQIIKKGARNGNTQVELGIGTLYIPIRKEDADSIELLEALLYDPDLKEITLGELVDILQEGLFQIQIRLKTETIIHPKLSMLHKKASFHVDRLIAEKHDEADALNIFQDAILWFAVIGILKYTDEQQAKKGGDK